MTTQTPTKPEAVRWGLTPVRSDAHAADTLDDAPYLAYALVQAFKLFIALVAKRWPVLR